MEDVVKNEIPLYATKPKEREEEEIKEQERARQVKPLLDEMLSWLDSEISYASNIDNILSNAGSRREDLMAQILAQKKLKFMLENKRAYLQNKYKVKASTVDE